MELKPGYKQTEVGVIPEDWDSIPLQQTCRSICRGASPRPINDPRWFDQSSNIGWVRISDVTRSRRYLRETTQRLSEEGIKRSRLIPCGALIMSICATVGRPIETEINTCIHDGFVVFEKPIVDQGFLYHVLCDLEPRWAKKGQTGSQMNLNTNLIKITSIPLPIKKEEQRAIATALSDVDALLDGLDRLIAKKRNLKQAAMQQLLTGKIRLPGFAEDWRLINIGQGSILKARIGWQGLTASEHLASGQYALITGTDFFDGKIDWNSCNFVKKERYDQDRYIQLQINDVLLTKDGTIGKSAFVNNLPYPATLNSGLFVIRPQNNSYVAKYLFYVLSSTIFIGFLNKLQAGSTISHLYQKDFVNFEFLAPETIEEQTAIATVLSDMDAEITALEQRRAKTRDIKQAMMQELLTGRIRIVQSDKSDTHETSTRTKTNPHSWAFNEAVVISMLAKHFGKNDFPLGRKRYTKLSYLLHRYAEGKAEGYLKKAAGPYNPKTKYGGPEQIALTKGYISNHQHGKYYGFIAGENIDDAETYFCKWYGLDAIDWLKQFQYSSNDELELLATVDMAAEELRSSGKNVNLASVKEVIYNHPEWQEKLSRKIFADGNIVKGIEQCAILFNSDSLGGFNGR